MKKDIFLQIVRSKAKTALTPEEENMFGSIGEAVERAFNEDAVTRAASIKEISDRLGSIEDGETIAGVIRGLAEKVDSMELKVKRKFTESEKFQLRQMLDAKKDEIVRYKQSGSGNPVYLEFRAKRAASAMMTNSTLVTGASAINNPNWLDELEVLVIQYPKNFILDAITARQVTKVPAVLTRKEEIAAGEGVVAVVTEGNTKPLIDKKFYYRTYTRKKYAGRIEMTEEVMYDMEQLVIMVVDMFEQDVLRAWQDGVLTDILAWAPAYTSTTLDASIVKPTVYSVIGAGKLHVQNNNYEPDVVILNPGDAAEAIYLQDNNGAQQFIPNDLQYGGLMPFVSNKITAGTIAVGTKSTVREQHGNFILRQGTYGTQFIENESTIVGEVFSILELPTVAQYSWCKLDVATVKAALLKPAVN